MQVSAYMGRMFVDVLKAGVEMGVPPQDVVDMIREATETIPMGLRSGNNQWAAMTQAAKRQRLRMAGLEGR